MEASAWSGGNGVFGVRVGARNRHRYFDPSWTSIVVELDGHPHSFLLTSGFWRHCPEFRDSGAHVIREWLEYHHAIDWPRGRPPRLELVPLGGGRFRLLQPEA